MKLKNSLRLQTCKQN